MSIPFFNSILSALGRKVNYDAVSNLVGNSFAKDSWKAVQEANPLSKPRKLNNGFLDMISGIAIEKNVDKAMEGVEWAK